MIAAPSCVAASSLPAGYTLRAPWPDELPRLRGLFHAPRLVGATWLRILLHDAPERIVGGFMVTMPAAPGQPGALLLRIRPAHFGGPAHEILLADALAVARGAGLSTLATRVTPDAPEWDFFLRHGATHARTDRFYAGDLLLAQQRLHPMRARLPASAARYAVRPLQVGDHPTLAAMAAAHGLLNAARATGNLKTDYDQAQSLVCIDRSEADAPVGALLVKTNDRAQVYVETRMVHPDRALHSGPINMLLITLACERWLEAGFTKFTLGCDPAKDLETVNFARRMRCHHSTEHHTLRWSL